jgi:4-nitrophenyl phosphatase
MRRYRLYLFDLDGTLLLGDEPIPHATHVVADLRRAGAQIGFLTNNSARTEAQQARRLRAAGFAARACEVVTSATAAVRVCHERGLRSAFVVGAPGLVQTLRKGGIRVELPSRDNSVPTEAVVCGIAPRFDYSTLSQAMTRIRAGAAFVATNLDPVYPMPGGVRLPGAGSLVAAIAVCAGQQPIVAGKPEPWMVLSAMSRAGVGAEDTVVVGDQPEMDVRCAVQAGCAACLVATGVATEPVPGVPFLSDLRGLLS